MLNYKKIPVISPLFHNNFICNFKEKSELFNEHFSEKCPLIQNTIYTTKYYSFNFAPLTHKSISLFWFSGNDIKSTINMLDPNKVHGQDMISICMIRFCGDSLLQTIV